MRILNRLAIASAAWCLWATVGSAAAQTSFAASTAVSTISPCPSFCGGPGGQFGSDIDGGEGFSSSMSSLTNIDGNGRAEATLSGQVGLPVLRAEAFGSATRSSQVQATAAGMQAFYVGQGGLPEYALNLALTGQATGTVRADVLVFRDTDPSSQPFFSTDRGTMQFEVIPSESDLEIVGELSLALPASGTAQSVLASIYIEDLAVGDLFYVWAHLSATGRNGTYGDAFNTLNLSYTDATGLSQLAPVPEPEAWMMLGAGLMVIGLRRRRVQPSRRDPSHSVDGQGLRL